MYKRYLIESPRFKGNPYIRTASASDWFTLMGVPELTKWPDGGVPPRWVNVIEVTRTNGVSARTDVKALMYVMSKPVKTNSKGIVVKSSQHRVMVACPGCKRVMSAGRLFQHKCKV